MGVCCMCGYNTTRIIVKYGRRMVLCLCLRRFVFRVYLLLCVLLVSGRCNVTEYSLACSAIRKRLQRARDHIHPQSPDNIAGWVFYPALCCSEGSYEVHQGVGGGGRRRKCQRCEWAVAGSARGNDMGLQVRRLLVDGEMGGNARVFFVEVRSVMRHCADW
jgi:hypothetical protein